jgi:hypothetical protein
MWEYFWRVTYWEREREREHRWGCSNIHTQNPKEADFGHTGHSTLTVLAASVFPRGQDAPYRVPWMMGSSYLDSKNDFQFSLVWLSWHLVFIFEPWWSPSIQILTFQKKQKQKFFPMPCQLWFCVD